MALKPKTAVFQLRIDPDLLRLFQAQCAHLDRVPSDVVRRYLRDQSQAWLKQGIGADLGALEGVGKGSTEKTSKRPVKSVSKGAR